MSGKTYSYSTTPTGQETLVTTTEQLIEVNQSLTLPSVVEPRSFCCQDFNNFVEEEKGRRHESINQVQKFAMAWEKILQEESEKNVAGLYEKLQESLETIQTALSSVETSEGQLQKVVSFPLSFLSVSLISFVPAVCRHRRVRLPVRAQGLQAGHRLCPGRRKEK